MARCPTCGNEIKYGACYVCSDIERDRKRSGFRSSSSGKERPERKGGRKSPPTKPRPPQKRRPKSSSTNGKEQRSKAKPVKRPGKPWTQRRRWRRQERRNARLRTYNRIFADKYAESGILSLILRALGFREDEIGRLKRDHLDGFLAELDRMGTQVRWTDTRTIEIHVARAANSVLKRTR